MTINTVFQELLLSVPNFLGKLLTYMCDRQNMNQTTSWVDYLDNVITEELGRLEDLFHLVDGDDVAHCAEYSTENLNGAVFERAQALYVLSLFLSGITR